jgi:hypothetical protein
VLVPLFSHFVADPVKETPSGWMNGWFANAACYDRPDNYSENYTGPQCHASSVEEAVDIAEPVLSS